MNPIKVSVCISVYNGANFIERCLDSVCSQTLNELEIIIINDGSTDDSQTIIEEYVCNHPERKFIVKRQENKGLSIGRLKGISCAIGDFITFLDADDYVDKTAYEKMVRCAERYKADIVEIRTKKGEKIVGSPYQGLHDSHEMLRQRFKKGALPSMLWLRMYNRHLFEKPVLPDIYTNNEDTFGILCLLHAARTIYFLPETLHIYSVDNDNSVMASFQAPQMVEKRFQARKVELQSLDFFYNFAGSSGMKEYEDVFYRYKAHQAFHFVITDFEGKTLEEKEDAVVETLHMNNRKELQSFLKRSLPIRSRFLFRLLGYRGSYFLFKMIGKK